ncbi:MAG TPA: DUF2182 domain-containing protein [Steroidobacteraceae bacterium]
MDAMAMPGGGTTASAMSWLPACGQTWIGAAASFLGMWTLMMTAMMLPSLIPMLSRYRQSVGRAGAFASALLTVPAAAGYLLIWTLLGAAVYPLGVAMAAATMRHLALARATPIAIGLVVLTAGALQLTRWKAHHLACCRGHSCRRSLRDGPEPPPSPFTALRHGMRLGFHCSQCCAGLAAILLVSGIMDVPAMVGVTAGITLERLAPAGERVARVIGAVMIVAGTFLTLHAATLM